MTPEELAAKLADLEAKNASYEAQITELSSKIPTPVAVLDPDEIYKPKTWKELDDRETAKAEQITLRILKESKQKEDDERKAQERDLEAQNKKIETAFAKLEAEGLIEKSESKDDVGGKQRAQILGSLVRSGGQHVEIEAAKLKTAWDAGLEYDYERNSFVAVGGGVNQNRSAVVGSSASRVSAPAAKGGPINVSGLGGNLDAAQERYLQANRA